MIAKKSLGPFGTLQRCSPHQYLRQGSIYMYSEKNWQSHDHNTAQWLGLMLAFCLCFSLLSLKLWPLTLKFILPNLVQASTPKLYMTTISYFQGRSNLHGTCAVLSYFDHLNFSLKIFLSLWKCCSGHCSEIINDNCFIFSEHFSLP